MAMSVISAKSEVKTKDKEGDKVENSSPTRVMGDGVVKWYNPARKFGFIAASDGSKDIFFQLRDCKKGFIPVEGSRVSYSKISDNKGIRAIDIQPL